MNEFAATVSFLIFFLSFLNLKFVLLILLLEFTEKVCFTFLCSFMIWFVYGEILYFFLAKVNDVGLI